MRNKMFSGMNGYELAPFGSEPDWLAGLLGGVAGAANGVQAGLTANAVDPTTGQTAAQMQLTGQLMAQQNATLNAKNKKLMLYAGGGVAALFLLVLALRK